MRVLVVVEQLRRKAPGGIGTYARGLLQGLSRMDTSGPGGRSGDGAAADGAPEIVLLASRAWAGPDSLPSFGRPVLTSALPGPLMTRAWDLGLLGAPRGFDVLHAVSLALPRSGTAAVAMVHDLAWREVPEAFPPRGRTWHEAALQRALRRARAFVVPSAQTAEALVRAGAGAHRVTIVEEGADHLPRPDASATAELLARLGVRGSYLLSVGTNEPRKNLDRLIEAYGKARQTLPEPWPLIVVGPQGWGNALRPEPGVVLAGAVPEPVLAGLYAGCRCLAYVPLHEGYGLPALEAMASGAPVLASPMPSTGGAALEVDPRDVAAIAEGLVEASVDSASRAEAVAAGQRRAAATTWESSARRHVELWERL